MFAITSFIATFDGRLCIKGIRSIGILGGDVVRCSIISCTASLLQLSEPVFIGGLSKL